MSTKNIYKYFIIVFAGLCFAACNNTDSPTVPSRPVNIRLNLTANYNTFSAPLEYLTFEKKNENLGVYSIGYGGILVNVTMESAYRAFDMSCPYEKDKDIKVRPESGGAFAVCEKCGSKFDLAYGYGYVEKGPAKDHLTQYKAAVYINNGIRYLHISQY